METTRLSNKGQIVIPKRVRVTHGWEPGLEFIVEETGNGIKLKPVPPYLETKAEELLGCVGYKGPKKSLKETEAAIAKYEKQITIGVGDAATAAKEYIDAWKLAEYDETIQEKIGCIVCPACHISDPPTPTK